MNSSPERERFCLKCRHSLRGLERPRCPECGREFDPDCPATFRRPGDRVHPRWLQPVAMVLTLYPVLFAILFYGTWLAAAVSLGHRPRPSLDDPKFINGSVSALHTLAVIALMLASPAMAATLLAIVVDAAGRWWSERRFPRFSLVLALVAACLWGGLIAVLSRDPGRLMVWFMD